MEKSTLILIIVALLLSVGIAYYQYYFKVKNRTKINVLLSIIRTLVFFLLFLLLINPSIVRIELINQKPKLSIIVDNSSSIKFFKKDTLVKSIIHDFKTHLKLNKRFNIDYYSFGNQFRLNDTLSFNEQQTNISRPLEKIHKLHKNSNNAIVLLSDGNQTVGNDYEYTILKEPIFAVVIGDTIKYKDVEITQVNANRYSFINNEFPVESLIQYTGESPVRLRYSIEKKGKIVFSKLLDFNNVNNSYLLQTTIKSIKEGPNFYTSKIQYLDNEKNTKNNSKNFSVDVIDKQSEVLIVSSFLHPDLGALRKSIETDKQRKVTIHLANNLDLNINDYQLVILYQPNNKFTKIIDELKGTKKSFFLITGSKTDWSFLNKKSLGVNKNYINQIENYSAKFNEGFLNFSQKNIGFDNFPPLVDKFGETSISIPNQILLFQNINGFTSQEPLLLATNDNNQKKIFLLGEGIWKWRSISYSNTNSFIYFDEFIGSLIQYASIKKNINRLDVDIKTLYNSNSIIRIGAFYVDNNFKFDNRATLLFSLINKKTKKKKILPFSLSGNSYQLKLNSLEFGDYEYLVTVEGQNISKKGIFKVNKFKVEEQFTKANKEKLEKLTEKTNGKLFFEGTRNRLIDELLADNRYKTIQKSIKTKDELINWQWIMLFIVVLLSIEWFTRKYYGKV